MKLRNLIRLNWPATCRLNYRAGGLAAVFRMPIKVFGRLRLRLGGQIVLPAGAGRNTLVIGSEHEDYTASAGRAELNLQGTWRIGGLVRLGPDCFVGIAPNAVLEMGDGCHIARDSQIHCFRHICFGRGVLAGELYATDSTAHQILNDGAPCPMTEEILVGDQVYLGFRTMLLHGCRIPRGSVVASGAVCCKDYTQQGQTHLLLAGVPAIIKETGVTFELLNLLNL